MSDPVWPTGPDWPRVDRWTVRGERWVLSLHIGLDSPWLEGHFPRQPVLPGVVQLHWAIGLTQAVVVDLDGVDSVHRLKFRRPLVPPLDVELTLDWQVPSRSLAFRYELKGALHSSGRVQFS